MGDKLLLGQMSSYVQATKAKPCGNGVFWVRASCSCHASSCRTTQWVNLLLSLLEQSWLSGSITTEDQLSQCPFGDNLILKFVFHRVTDVQIVPSIMTICWCYCIDDLVNYSTHLLTSRPLSFFFQFKLNKYWGKIFSILAWSTRWHGNPCCVHPPLLHCFGFCSTLCFLDQHVKLSKALFLPIFSVLVKLETGKMQVS